MIGIKDVLHLLLKYLSSVLAELCPFNDCTKCTVNIFKIIKAKADFISVNCIFVRYVSTRKSAYYKKMCIEGEQIFQ